MGILNVTPDSFSDGGKWNDMDRAMAHAEQMIAEGATIIDVGGESTRPGYTMISDQEEISRVVPVIRELKKRFDVAVSIDTYKSGVAKAAVEAGADMVNDIWGLKYDPKMADVIAKTGAACCLMHNRKEADYSDFMEDMLNDLREIHHVDRLLELGYPVLLGTSRKSVIGLTLDLPAAERVEGTVATSVIGVMKGCAFVRVHDVKENERAIRMTEAVLDKGKQ